MSANGAIGIEDATSGIQCAYIPDVQDCALIVRGNLDGRTVIVIAGFEAQGTLKAIELLTKPDSRVLRQLNAFDRDDYAEIVVRTRKKPGSNAWSEAEPYEFGSIENPRGR